MCRYCQNVSGQWRCSRYQSDTVLRLVDKECRRQCKHQERANDPVLNERNGQHLLVLKYLAKLLILDLRERWVRHYNQAHSNRDGCGSYREPNNALNYGWGTVAKRDSYRHRQKYPQCKVSVQKRQSTAYCWMIRWWLNGLLCSQKRFLPNYIKTTNTRHRKPDTFAH